MAIVDGYCPHCGGKNRHRESSKGTIQRCDYCGQKYKILTDEEAAAKIAEEAARAEEQRKAAETFDAEVQTMYGVGGRRKSQKMSGIVIMTTLVALTVLVCGIIFFANKTNTPKTKEPIHTQKDRR